MTSNLDSLKKVMRERNVLSHFILAILYQSGNRTIIKNRETLFRIFEQIAKESEIPVLKNMEFNHTGKHLYPYSTRLEFIFNKLEIAELLPYVFDANGSYYVLLDENRDKINYDRFSEAETAEIERHALKFKALEKRNQRSRK